MQEEENQYGSIWALMHLIWTKHKRHIYLQTDTLISKKIKACGNEKGSKLTSTESAY